MKSKIVILFSLALALSASAAFADDGCTLPSDTCVSNCTARDSSGNCYEYGADYCGPNASCVSDCTATDSSGNCYEYGSDVCSSDTCGAILARSFTKRQ
jgi:hypothetical protein